MSLSRGTIEHDWDRKRAWPAMGAILVFHAAALWGLMQIESFREAVKEAAPIMVGLISVAPPEPPKPEPPPPPKPPEVKPKPAPQMIAAETPAPAPIEVPLPEPEVFEQAPPPAPQADPAPAPIIPPNFVAAYLDNPAPRYPDSSKRLGETGRVTLRVRVSALGLPESVEVERSSGYSRLDRTAMDAVRKWKFVPAKQGEQAVPATVLVPLNFELNNS